VIYEDLLKEKKLKYYKDTDGYYQVGQDPNPIKEQVSTRPVSAAFTYDD
jgi:hypothetical protein